MYYNSRPNYNVSIPRTATSIKKFAATIDGECFFFTCYWNNTRDGFMHGCIAYSLPRYKSSVSPKTIVSYLNRTWENFEYETVLKKAIEKFPKRLQAQLTEQIIKANQEFFD